MAKMFYTLEEAAQRLGATPEQVREMAASGQLQEFRDRDRLMFKKEHVDLLSGHEGDEDVIPLASSGESGLGISLEDSSSPAASGSGIVIDDTAKERSGISIFDADQLDTADPSDVTQITTAQGGDITMESVGSGSGLLDLTREGDDTSLGAELLEGVYSGDESGAFMTEGDTQGASGLFETTGAASDVSSVGMAPVGVGTMVAVEPYDGPGSGFAGGAALGMILVLLLALTPTLLGIVGVTRNPFTDLFASLDWWLWLVIMIGVVGFLALIGWVIGRKS